MGNPITYPGCMIYFPLVVANYASEAACEAGIPLIECPAEWIWFTEPLEDPPKDCYYHYGFGPICVEKAENWWQAICYMIFSHTIPPS